MKNKMIPYYMNIAHETAKLSVAKRAQVGCIIVKDNRIISIGYNGMPSGWTNDCETTETWNDIPHMRDKFTNDGAVMHDSPHGATWSKLKTKDEVLHAETNAIAKVAQSNDNCKDATLFCTHEPCIQCAKLIFQSGITTVYYKHSYNAAVGRGREFLDRSGCTVEQLS